MILSPPDLASLQHIARNMRERDRREVCAELWTFDPDGLAIQLLDVWRVAGAWGQVASLEGEPVAQLIAWWRTPSTVQVSVIATDRWREIVRPFSLHVRHEVIPLLLAHGVKRAECRAMATHEDARRWLTWLGATEECLIPNWGKGGETFVQYAWDADNVRRSDSKEGRGHQAQPDAGSDAHDATPDHRRKRGGKSRERKTQSPQRL